jgi:intergrase/recombinase
MAYISIVTEDLVAEIAQSKPVSYFAIRKRIVSNKQSARIKELRSYFATFLRQHEILAEYIDLLQGRTSKSVLPRYYLNVENVKTLALQLLKITEKLKEDLIA